MPWVRIDEHALNHVKILALSDGAFRLWVEGLAHCQKHLTDGRISRAALNGFRYANKRRIGELTTSVEGHASLWELAEDGYAVHDYLAWNDPRDKVVKERQKAHERYQRFKGRRDGAVANDVANGVSDDVATGVHNHKNTPLGGKSTPERPRARGPADRTDGVGAGTFPRDHLDHVACGPVCFTPRMTAKFIGRFGQDRERLRVWAERICSRERQRIDAGGAPPGFGDDFAYWTAAYDAEFGGKAQAKPPGSTSAIREGMSVFQKCPCGEVLEGIVRDGGRVFQPCPKCAPGGRAQGADGAKVVA